jgi:hypothetical protein
VRVLDQRPTRAVEVVSGICHSERDCPEGEHCLGTRRCAMADQLGVSSGGAPSVAPPPASSEVASAAPLPGTPDSGAQPVPAAAANAGPEPQPTPAPARATRGCAGCEVARMESHGPAWSLALVISLWAMRRGRSRSE